MSRINVPGGAKQLFVVTTIAAILVTVGGGRLPAQPPAPPAVQIKRLNAQMGKFQAAHAAEVSKVEVRYANQVAKLNLPWLNVEIARLYMEEQTLIWNLVDRGKIKAVQQKYQPELQTLRRQIKERNAQIAQLITQWKIEKAKIQTACDKKIAGLDVRPPETQLEDLLKRVLREERVAICKLIDATQLAKTTAALQTTVAELTQQIDSKRVLTRKWTKQMNSQIANVNSFAKKRLDKLDVAENPLELQLQRVLAKQQIELDGTTDAQQQNRIRDNYRPRIDSLNEAIRTRDAEKATVNQERASEIAVIQQKYAEATATADLPDETLAAKLRAAQAEEYAALLSLLNAQQVEAINTKYRPQIVKLEERVQAKAVRIAELLGERDALLAAAMAEYQPKLAKLQAPADRLEYKVVRVEERQSAEIMQLLDVNRVRNIQAKYEPRIQGLMRDFTLKQRQFMVFSIRAQADIQRSFMNLQARSAPLELRIYQLSLHHGRK